MQKLDNGRQTVGALLLVINILQIDDPEVFIGITFSMQLLRLQEFGLLRWDVDDIHSPKVTAEIDNLWRARSP